jgi:hypothetical protein
MIACTSSTVFRVAGQSAQRKNRQFQFTEMQAILKMLHHFLKADIHNIDSC